MAQQMMNTIGVSLSQQQQQLEHQEQRNDSNSYELNGSSSGESRPVIFNMPPPQLKDKVYWEKRFKNNEAAKRSQAKKRLYEIELMRKMIELSKENFVLKTQLMAIEQQFGIRSYDTINTQQVMPVFPINEQMSQTATKRPRTSLQQTTSSAAAVYSQNHVGSTTPGAQPSLNVTVDDGRPARSIPAEQQQQQQQQEQRRRGAYCPEDAEAAWWSLQTSMIMAAAGAGHTLNPFAPIVPSAPPLPTRGGPSTDGALDLTRNGSCGAAAGPSVTQPTPVIWRAFATDEPGSVAATELNCGYDGPSSYRLQADGDGSSATVTAATCAGHGLDAVATHSE